MYQETFHQHPNFSFKENLPYNHENPEPVTIFETNSNKEDQILQHVEAEADTRIITILEGPPIYLWPADQFPSQQWDNPAFTKGWEMINHMSARLDPAKTQHFVLIDELNGKPDNTTSDTITQRLQELQQSSAVIDSSPVFQKNQEHINRYNESQFATDSENLCSSLDAGFQREKIIFQLDTNNLSIEKLNQMLLVTVHPSEFESQQSLMLSALLSKMKEKPLSQIPKKERRDLITSIYRHIWLDQKGSVTNITQPEWNGNKFIFKDIV